MLTSSEELQAIEFAYSRIDEVRQSLINLSRVLREFGAFIGVIIDGLHYVSLQLRYVMDVIGLQSYGNRHGKSVVLASQRRCLPRAFYWCREQ